MEFFTQAVDVLKVLVMAVGAGLGVWRDQPDGRLRERQPWRQEPRCEAVDGGRQYRPYRLKTHSASCQCTKVGGKGAMKCLGYSTR